MKLHRKTEEYKAREILVDLINTTSKSESPKKFWGLIKKTCRDYRFVKKTNGLRFKDGTPSKNEAEELQIWNTYLEDTFVSHEKDGTGVFDKDNAWDIVHDLLSENTSESKLLRDAELDDPQVNLIKDTIRIRGQQYISNTMEAMNGHGSELFEEYTMDDLTKAMDCTDANKATGADGIPNEVWKALKHTLIGETILVMYNTILHAGVMPKR